MKPHDFSGFEERIHSAFRNKDLLTQAFTHRSYLNEHPKSKFHHNERLEFLGDAVLELIVTEFLFKKYPEKSEGELTSLRAALVNTNTLSDVSSEIGVNDYLLLSRGERQDTGKARQYILANTFEAVVGALYLDRGYEAARVFVEQFIFPRLEAVVSLRLWQDAKSRFQEKAQEILNITPTYEVLEESGPDHNKIFTVGVFLNGAIVAQGKGSSKQDAEQYAAKEALEKKGWN